MDEQHEIGIAAHRASRRGKDQRARLINIEGIIGAGKSTLTKAIAEMVNAKAFYEPVAENPYLDVFYKDPKKHAFAMQFWLMSRRFEMHKQAVKHIWETGQSVIMDRSIYGDWVFAKKNWQDGNISDIDYKNYLQHREVMNAELLVPHITVWLNAHPVTCRERIDTRGRECEKTIPLDYLRGLHNLHAELMEEMRNRGSTVVALDWDVPFESVSDVATRLGF